ncbi:MAG: nucleotide exchange factor GrpE [Candidatus Omnitrophota bacterium]|nr:nucleotide exchange factor GrpE [Candidatus Omnitrophota bacterium]
MRKKKEEKPILGPDEVSEDIALLKEKADKCDEYESKYLKVHAEYENTRRRLEKEKNDHMKFANENIIARLFPIMDNFDMAFVSMEKAEDKSAVMEGIKMVQKEFHKVLGDNGVEKISTEGQKFDPNFHEAVMMVETEEYPDGAIMEEVRSGYTLNGRLLRPAQVKIAKNDKG